MTMLKDLPEPELQLMLGRMEFPPDFRVRVWETNFRMNLHIEMKVLDSRDERPNRNSWIKVERRNPIPPYLSGEDEFFDWVRREMHEMVRHEMDEWLKVDGERRWDPHG